MTTEAPLECAASGVLSDLQSIARTGLLSTSGYLYGTCTSTDLHLKPILITPYSIINLKRPSLSRSRNKASQPSGPVFIHKRLLEIYEHNRAGG